MRTLWVLVLAAASAVSTIVPILGDGAAGDGVSTPLKIMFVGDSITHGHEGAYTWRYRMWQWLKFNDIKFKFVGPYTGTIAPEEPHALQPPRPIELPFHQVNVDEWPRISGGYAEDIDKRFDPHHFATSGDRADRVYSLIQDRVREFQPDMLLVLLGVNDFGWGDATPDLLLSNMKRLVENARNAKNDVKMAIGNVIQRDFVRPSLEADTDTYNKMLEAAIPTWFSAESPVYYVDVAGAYACHANGTCPGGIDGLHPNELGAFQIASAFANTFINDFSLGKVPIQIPSSFSMPDLAPPSNIRASATPMGTKVTWDRRYGITEFQVRQRPENGTWMMKPSGMNRSDTVFSEAGIQCEYQVRSCYGNTCGPWPEEVAIAISDRDTAPHPINIKTAPTRLGFNVTWEPPEGNWNISSWEIAFKNHNVGNTLSVGSERNWAILEGMEEGKFSIVGVVIEVQMASWMGEGYGGVYSPRNHARPVLPGSLETPKTPTDLVARRLNSTAVRLAWKGHEGDAAGYLTYLRVGHSDPVTDGFPVFANEGIVAFGGQYTGFEVCVRAVNGHLDSPLACVTPPWLNVDLKAIPKDYKWILSQDVLILLVVLAVIILAYCTFGKRRFWRNMLRGRQRRYHRVAD